jgi:hypothetical protein
MAFDLGNDRIGVTFDAMMKLNIVDLVPAASASPREADAVSSTSASAVREMIESG